MNQREVSLVALLFLTVGGSVLAQALRKVELVAQVDGEPLLFAHLMQGSTIVATADEFGRVSLPCNTHTTADYVVSAFGSAHTIALPPVADCGKVLVLAVDMAVKLTEITVSSAQEQNTSTQSFQAEELVNVPMFLGQPDILRGLALKSGVSAGQEGSASLYVRGGTPDQTMILIDDAPVYNVNHLGGFMSVFNDDAIKSVTLYKTTPPIAYGNRLSGLVDVRLKNGPDEKWRGKFGLGLFSANGYVEGPLVKDRTKIVIGTRLGYWGLANIGKSRGPEANLLKLNMRDGLVKVTHTFSPRHRIFLSAYHSYDQNSLGSTSRNLYNDGDVIERRYSLLDRNYGNNTVSLRHYYEFSPALGLVTFAYRTSYQIRLEELTRDYRSEELAFSSEENILSTLKESGAVTQLNISSGRATTTLGIGYSAKQAHPYQITVDGLPAEQDGEATASNTLTAFVNRNWKLSDTKTFEVGGRASSYRNVNYQRFLPEVRVRWLQKISRKWRFSVSGNYSHQDVYLVAGSRVGFSFDTYGLADSAVVPQRGWQLDWGVNGDLGDWGKISLGAYYRNMSKVTYLETSKFNSSDVLELLRDRSFKVGEGHSRGVELEYSLDLGKTDIHLAYTLSRTRQQFAELNAGKAFPFRYDRPHDLSATAGYRINDRYRFGAAFILQSGIVITSPTSSVPTSVHLPGGAVVPSLNNVRIPTYHRLDVFVSKRWEGKKGNTNEVKISIYNIYNRINPTYYSSYVTGSGNNNFEIVRTKIGQFGFLPSIYYAHDFGDRQTD